MEIEIIETRNYVGIGLKKRGDILRTPKDCSEKQARQFIEQRFAKERAKLGVKPTMKEN